MRDYLGYRAVLGIATPSINTCVQPEYDRMRPPGVTNQVARMSVPDLTVGSDADFAEVIERLFGTLDQAVDQILTCRPDHLILGISALAVWGGTRASSEELKHRIASRSASPIGVSLATDAITNALGAFGAKRIAIVEPYYPVIQPRIVGFFEECGFEVVRINHLRGPQLTEYTRVDHAHLIDALRSVDGPDVDAVVQFGANLPMAAMADEAERWLGKPVIAVNVATYWHALRAAGIQDRLSGHTRLLAEF